MAGPDALGKADNVSHDDVLFEVRDRVAYVTLNRPAKLNALTRAMQRRVADLFAQVRVDPDIWAVLLTGAGDRAFCAGADLREIADEDRHGAAPWQPGQDVAKAPFDMIINCGKPVVAALNGLALGGGCELALSSDVRLAADNASIGMPEAKVGMGGNYGAHLLSRLVPPGIAYEMLYLGRPMSADDARHWGLVNNVVPHARLADEAERFIRAIVANAPLTQRRHRAILTHGRDLPLSVALQLSYEPNPYTSEDRIEGVAAFAERRAPTWKAR